MHFFQGDKMIIVCECILRYLEDENAKKQKKKECVKLLHMKTWMICEEGVKTIKVERTKKKQNRVEPYADLKP